MMEKYATVTFMAPIFKIRAIDFVLRRIFIVELKTFFLSYVEYRSTLQVYSWCG